MQSFALVLRSPVEFTQEWLLLGSWSCNLELLLFSHCFFTGSNYQISCFNPLRSVNIAGIMFQDITTLLLDPQAFKDTVDLFVERYKGKNISVVAGIKLRREKKVS